MAAEQAQKMAASTERRNVYLTAKKKQQRLKSEELARVSICLPCLGWFLMHSEIQ